jgi:hypothetical protein
MSMAASDYLGSDHFRQAVVASIVHKRQRIFRRANVVRFAPESGHQPTRRGCPLSATSGLMQCSKPQLFDYLVGQLLKMQGHVEAKRLGGLQVDDQLELGG